MTLNTKDISQYLDQKYPFNLIDRVTDFEINKEISGYKNVSTGCIYFQPETADIPVFVLLELMGQLSELMLRMSFDLSSKKGFLAGVQNVEFNKINQVCNQLFVKNELQTSFSSTYKTTSTIYHNNKQLCKGSLIHVFK